MPRLALHFGLPRLRGHFVEYQKSFNLVELPCEPEPPTAKHLARLRREAREGFQFAVVANRALTELSSSTLDPALVEGARRTAQALDARWLVVRTPASAGPSARTRAKLARVTEALAGAAKGIAWEPRGMWTDEEIAAVAEELSVTPVRDLAEQDAPPATVVYTRLLALGRNSRLGSGAIERVTERLEGAEEAFVVIEGEGAAGVAKRLRASLGEARADAAAALDDQVDEELSADDEDADDEDADDDEDGDLEDEQDDE